MQLNPQQEQVAEHVYGRILTLAGPGSGKTRTLTERTGRLMRKGIDAGNILCLTFTNKARDEMRQRIVGAYGQNAARVTISNFHGLCGVILRKLGQPLGYSPRMTILDSDDQIDLILQIARKKGMEPSKPAARAMAMVINDWRENLGGEADLDELADGKLRDGELSVVREYIRTLAGRNQTDFSGLLSETVRLLRDHHDVRGRLQTKFRFIQVDEYQDTNRAQNEIVELLAGEEDNVLAVGDADQSIYAWRGASPDAIPQFIRNGQKKTGACTVVKLGLNYRSTPEVIAVADRLIRHTPDRIEVEFSTIHKSGEPVKLARFAKPEDEAEGIAENIRTLMREGNHPREMAIFYRTNDMSRLVEQALAKRQIPYRVIGSGSYYDRMEVKDVLSMLRFACNPKDGIAFHRIANKPARGMGDALIGRLETYAEQTRTDVLTAIHRAHEIRDDQGKPLTEPQLAACREVGRLFDLPPRASVADIAEELFSRSGYDQWLRARYDDKGEYEDRRRNVDELLRSIRQFAAANRGASIADYLQSISLYTDGDEPRTDDAVRLMSLHASKGLEFDIVYMIGVEHGILPHDKAIEDRGEAGIEEERRLCYVGFTRARKILRVTWCETRLAAFSKSRSTRRIPTRPSRFLVEAGLMSPDEYDTAVNIAKAAWGTKRR
jgi:DNA helicase II / ATP-dependent DNA helicase PcrA